MSSHPTPSSLSPTSRGRGELSEKPRAFDLELPPLPLEQGGEVGEHRVRGSWWGPPTDLEALEEAGRLLGVEQMEGEAYRIVRGRGDGGRRAGGSRPLKRGELDPTVPTILVVHALTGDMRPGGPGGFWQPVVGPGLSLDPSHHRILCFNNLGSCYGTSGPPDPSFPRTRDARFPATITTWDQARSILLALDALGIDRVHLSLGGSIGGMIVLCLAALAPERFERILPIAACEATSAWVIGWNHVARQALLLDPEYPSRPSRGLQIARQIAMLTYRAEPGLEERQGRELADQRAAPGPFTFQVGSYLEHQGRKLHDRFDAESYLLQLGAMDHHDLGRPPPLPSADEPWAHDGRLDGSQIGDGELSWGLSRIRASARVVYVDTDNLCQPEQSRALVERLRRLGRYAESGMITSPHGHDGFLIEWAQLANQIDAALSLPAGEDE